MNKRAVFVLLLAVLMAGLFAACSADDPAVTDTSGDDARQESTEGTVPDGTDATVASGEADPSDSAADPTQGTDPDGESKPAEDVDMPSEPLTATEATEETDPTVPAQSITGSSEPAESTAVTTEPPADITGPTTDITEPPTEPACITYEEYMQMDAYQKQAYYETFPDMSSFFEWYNAAKSEYDKAHPPIDAGNGPIDIGGN